MKEAEKQERLSTRVEIIDFYLRNQARFLPTQQQINSFFSTKTQVSVVIPAFNECLTIAELLESLNKQKTAIGYEVIIVDNESKDQTADIVRDYMSQVQYPLYLLSEKLPGAGDVRKTGCDEVLRRLRKRDGYNIKPHIIALTDADTIVPPFWIENISRAVFKETQPIAVSGTHGPKREVDELIESKIGIPDYFKRISRLAAFLEQTIGQIRFRGPNSALEIETYAAAGGFRQLFDKQGRIAPRECLDLALRIKRKGYLIKPLQTEVTVSQRRHLAELLGETESYTSYQPDGRFITVRESESELLYKALEKVPLATWKKYQLKILTLVIKNVLIEPLAKGELNLDSLKSFLTSDDLTKLVVDVKSLPLEEVSEKWVLSVVKTAENHLK